MKQNNIIDILLYYVLPIILGITCVVILASIIICLINCHLNWNKKHKYNKVSHELDEEEIEFKTILEKNSENKYIRNIMNFINTYKFKKKQNKNNEDDKENISYDELPDEYDDDIFDSNDLESFDFNTSDKEKLNLLEKLRNNLISTSIDATNKINENNEELYESEAKIKDSDNEYLRL